MNYRVRYFLYNLITDQNKKVIFKPVKFVLFLWSLVYGWWVGFIIFLYQRQFLKPKKIKGVVISIGNITLGGTGKTPLVFYLAQKLKNNYKKVAILTRGYGEDEKFLFLENQNSIPVLIGKNRIKNAYLTIAKDQTEVLLLDDGMQQWGLHKDLELVVIDSTNPFGNSCLIPRGILREPIFGLRRAGLIVISKVDQGLENLAAIRRKLLKVNSKAIILEAAHQPVSLYDVYSNQNLDLSFIKNKEIIILSALGDNQYFKYTIEKLGARVKFHFMFMDHYQYQKDDWQKIVNYSLDTKIDIIVTTSKDMVKLKKIITSHNLLSRPIKLLVLEVEFKILKGENLLDERLSAIFNS